MLRKLHLKLTFLCAGITISIMILMSFLYLYVAEKNLHSTSFTAFQTDMDTLISHLEEQSIIRYSYLNKLQVGGEYHLHLWDNGTPLLFNEQETDITITPLFETARNYYQEHFKEDSAPSPYVSVHQEFTLSSKGNGKTDYYACVGYVNNENGIVEICVLKSLRPLQSQINKQRLSFLCLILLSAILLFLFSSFFTWKLLQPIAVKQKQQLEFIAAASHELRTPLSVLLSALSACKKAPTIEQHHFFEIMEEEGQSMSRLISDLLTLAQADEQRFSMNFTECSADTLLLNLYEAYESKAKSLGYILKIELPDMPLPTVCWDMERIRQVICILIENALAYTPKGSQITLNIKQKDRYIHLCVYDNGPGIPMEHREKIFQRFYREDSARSSNGHFGLGLSIAKELVTSHKGNIHVSDTPNGGAMFVVSLPTNPF